MARCSQNRRNTAVGFFAADSAGFLSPRNSNRARTAGSGEASAAVEGDIEHAMSSEEDDQEQVLDPVQTAMLLCLGKRLGRVLSTWDIRRYVQQWCFNAVPRREKAKKAKKKKKKS